MSETDKIFYLYEVQSGEGCGYMIDCGRRFRQIGEDEYGDDEHRYEPETFEEAIEVASYMVDPNKLDEARVLEVHREVGLNLGKLKEVAERREFERLYRKFGPKNEDPS